MSSSVKPFIFLHIPKTGGVTFHNIITNQYRFHKHYLIKLKDLSKWYGLSNENKLKYKVIKGHFPFSENFYPGVCNYFTFLRNPEKRIISHFKHIKSTPSHKLYSKLNNGSYSFYDFLKNGDAPLFDNCMVRFISGNYKKAYGSINENDLEVALKNFDTYFEHFGLVEDYDRSLLLLSYELGWNKPYYVSLNKSDETDTGVLDEKTMDLIKVYSKYDHLLWEYAKNKFALKVAQYGVRLERDLVEFKNENRKNIFLRNIYYQLKDKFFRQNSFKA